MSWDKTTIELNVSENSRTRVEFKYLGDDTIAEVTSSCGCTAPSYNPESKTLVTFYKAGSVPHHLKSRGYYVTEQRVMVGYKGKKEGDVLKLAIKVEK